MYSSLQNRFANVIRQWLTSGLETISLVNSVLLSMCKSMLGFFVNVSQWRSVGNIENEG